MNEQLGPVLSRYFAAQAVRLLPLTPALSTRVGHVVALLDGDGRATVKIVHENLCPELTVKSANVSIGRLVKSVNDAAKNGGIPVRLVISADKKPGAEGRWLWFEGAAGTPDLSTPELDRIEPGALVENARGIPTEARPVVVLFTYNEHETAAVLNRFGRGGKLPEEVRDGITYTHLGIHGGHLVVHRVSGQGQAASQSAAEDADREWSPAAMISVGIAFGQAKGKQQIGDVLVATAVYDYELTRQSTGGVAEPRGLSYPASDVLEHRIRHLNQTKPAATSALTWPRLHMGVVLSGNKLVDDADFKTELARLRPGSIGGEMEGLGLSHVGRRRRFDWALVKAICDWGDGTKNNPRKDEDQRTAADNAALVVFGALAVGPLWPSRGGSAATVPVRTADQRLPPPSRFSGVDAIGDRILDVRAMPVSMDKHAAMSQAQERSRAASDVARPAGVDVLETLLEWVDSDAAPTVFALLGEYGMGKTISCQRLVVRLQQLRQQDSARRAALYFDLRSVTGLDRRVPTLDEILVECMSRDWQRSGDANAFTAEQVFQWLDAGSVIVFDGLDEALVKMSGRDGQTFTRTLLGIADIAKNRNCPPPRVLISCRTQYFRTLRDQQNHFTGHERRNTGPEQFRAVTLLPLTDEQILGYLRAALPEQDPEQLLDMIRGVHNLPELAQRPFTLALIAEFIPGLEAARAAGRPVFGVTLYRAMATTWLDRDEGKHHIRPEDKLLLAEDLAAHLWRNRVTTLPARDLENWFHQWHSDTPTLTARYAGMPIDQLEEDLRTATFLARVDDGPAPGFRFSHTSLQEFFLAELLLHAVVHDDPDRWAMHTPSNETLGFLAQSLAERDDGRELLDRLTTWGRVRRTNVNENILEAALAARRANVIGPGLRSLDLTGADISDRVLDGRNGNSWLDLSEAKLSGMTIRRTHFAEINIDGADFSGSDLAQSEFLDCPGTACWLSADTGGAYWREHHHSETAVGASDRPSWAVTCALETHAKPLRWTSGHTDGVLAVGFSPDGALLATAGFDGTVRLWNPGTGEVVCELTGHTGGVEAVGFSPDGALLATSGEDGTVRLWNPGTGEVVRELTGHTGGVEAVAFSPDGALLATSGEDGTVRLSNPGTGEVVCELTGHTGGVEAVGFSPDGALLATSGEDGTVRLWNPGTGEVVRELTGDASGVRAVAFSPDGALLATAGRNGTVRLSNSGTGEVVRELTGHTGWVRAVAFSPDGALLATAGFGGTVRLWNPGTGEVVRELTGHTAGVEAVAFSPDGALLATAGFGGTVRLWNSGTGEVVRELTGHTGGVEAVAFSPDGALLATAGFGGTVRLWNSGTGEVVCELTGHTGGVEAVGFSPDGALLATAGRDGTVRLWNPGTGEVVCELTGHTAGVRAVAFSPDGALLATAGRDGTVRLSNSGTGEVVRELTGHTAGVEAVAFSPDGALLATAGFDGTVRLWNPGTGRRFRRELTGDAGGVEAVAFSPDGALLATAGLDGTVRLWNPGTGEVVRELTGHTAGVEAVAFSPDGALLATAGLDGTVRLWNPRTGTPEVVYGFVRPDRLGISGSASWNPNTNELRYAAGAYWRALHTYTTGPGGQSRLTAVILPADSQVPGVREVAFRSVVPAG